MKMFDLKPDTPPTGEVSGRFRPSKEIKWFRGEL
jgi:hypothetical protein